MTDLTVMKIEAKRRYLWEVIVSLGQWDIKENVNVRHEDCPEINLRHVELVTSLRSITESKDETSH
jgi:hypothetical protein